MSVKGRLATLAGIIRLMNSGRPVSNIWGFDRGNPVDRVYIERFLEEQRWDIRGRVLEVKDSSYTRRYGSGVTAAEVLDVDAANPKATLVADLSKADPIAANRYDCIILTQVLQLIHDLRGAIEHAHRILAPGGTLLATVPCVSRIVPRVEGNDWWRFTPAGCDRLFKEVFDDKNLTVRGRGNVVAAMAFLAGLASEELPSRIFRDDDPDFPLIVTVRALKAPA